MRASPIFQLPIMPSIWIAAENIHCAFSFRNLQSLMSLSKLQKLDPSAIDKCATVFVPPLACEKRRNGGVFLTPLRNLQTRAEFIAPFTSEE
jgi:hypothetical protein